MRTIELSNHPRDALRLARERRAASGQQDRAAFAQAAARHQLLTDRAIAGRDRARREGRWLGWLRGTLAVRRLRRLAPVPPPDAGTKTDREEALRAGIAGEQQVAADFGRALGDDWVLIRGYCNGGGEIDHLLLGPPGLIAIESKHRNATVHCDGDAWRFEKFDRYGNLKEHGAFADRRGRSPSVQLNQPADQLAEFLSSRGARVSLMRVVLLTHPNSKRGTCSKPTVHIAFSATALARELDDMPPVLGSAQRARLEDLICRDHRYHEGRRKKREAPARASARRS